MLTFAAPVTVAVGPLPAKSTVPVMSRFALFPASPTRASVTADAAPVAPM